MSNSSAPSYVTGDMVFIDKEFSLEEYQIGDPILYKSSQIRSIIIIHRIFDIQEVNNTLFFAIKGDANPQPDLVSEIPPIFNENRTVEVTWDYFYPDNENENPESQIAFSYFPAQEVVLGRVITKIPIVGWVFVPFKSPIGLFGINSPISFFSLFFSYFILVGLISLFYLIYKANDSLRNFLRTVQLTNKPPHQKFISSMPNFYQMLLIPLLAFELTFLFTPSLAITINTEITLTKSEFLNSTNPHWNLEYLENVSINTAQLSQQNITLTSIQIANESISNLLQINISKSFHGVGKEILSENQYNIIEYESYVQLIVPTNMFVLSSNDSEDPSQGKIFDYIIPQQKENPIGLMTFNVFLAAQTTSYNYEEAYQTSVDYTFIQESARIRWFVEAFFSSKTGFLQYLSEQQTESLYFYPEMISIAITVGFLILYYEILRSKLQKSMDKKYKNVLKFVIVENKEDIETQEKFINSKNVLNENYENINKNDDLDI